ncbi:hypothetical protein ILUMI_00771 [Ignelater luminosus]|uniref:Mos1 transposase HTH domain-containing protein n=1 Tax=Ignelater luminosus TaxID=2038154 RepID=A0A8K0GMT7_IGNLU|nr:hypothetical protein ILUMI_00771 [Ignelater luminosus]
MAVVLNPDHGRTRRRNSTTELVASKKPDLLSKTKLKASEEEQLDDCEYGDLVKRRNSYSYKVQLFEGISMDECVDELKNVMGDDCLHQTTVFRWYRESRRGDFSTDDKPRSGRRSDVVTSEVINKVSNSITENRRISYRQIEEILAISAPSVHKILHEHLKVRQVCTLWVPHSLTVKQMACRMV